LSRPVPGRAANPLTAERTTLAWSRTSFAFLVNGALLAIKDLHGAAKPEERILALMATLVALGTYVIAVRRQHTLGQRPLPARITPRRQVYVVGISALLLIVVTAVAQLH
jgi:uncharacterized membrane protein YidH (DUF202 family)